MAKHMLVLPDASFNEILNFLDAVEVHGKTIKTIIDPLEEADPKKKKMKEVTEKSEMKC